MKQKTPEELMNMHSGDLMCIIDECKMTLLQISEELTEAVTIYKALERMLPHKLAVLKAPFLDLGCSRNESMDRAVAMPAYEKELLKLNEAYDEKKRLEIQYEIFLNNLKAITSLAFLRNQELKAGV